MRLEVEQKRSCFMDNSFLSLGEKNIKSSNVPFILPYHAPPSSASSSNITPLSRGTTSRDPTQTSRDSMQVPRDNAPPSFERVGCNSGGGNILPPRRSPTINLPKQPITNVCVHK